MRIRLVNAKTGELIEEQYFVDSTLSWRRDKLGRWYLHHDHNGMPTYEWLAENPCPR